MCEINNFAQQTLKFEKFVNNQAQVKENPVSDTKEETELKVNDDKEISTKDPKNNNNTNLSFVEVKQPVTAIFAMGFSVHSVAETRQLLNIGFSLASKLGNDAVSNNRICIQGEPVTSILMNVVILAARIPVQNPGNSEERKQAFSTSVHTFEKMANDNTEVEGFSESEKQFLWKNAGIKVQKNENGKVDYLYFESPEGQPKKLSKQDLIDIYSHVLNIVNDESLFKTAREMGKKLEKQIADDDEEIKHEQSEHKEITSPQTSVKANNSRKTEQNDNSVEITDIKETENKPKINPFENDYINEVSDRKKEDAKYHNRKLDEINQERFQKNHEKAEKLTDETVNKINQETKLQEKKK